MPNGTFTMVFILDPGDCDVSNWSVTNEQGTPIGSNPLVRIGNKGVFKWTYTPSNPSDLSVEVKITGPTDGQITMPAGMEGLATGNDTPRWYSLAPYQPIFGTNTVKLKLERANEDHVYYNVFYPTWVPGSVADGVCALICRPTMLPLDFGEIQSVTKTYHANNTVVPIMCYGYKRSFVMDLGTTMTVSLKYIRVEPKDWVPEDDNSGDSRRWSNGKWLEYLRNLMNTWQMRTNGQQLYLLNPSSNRFSNVSIEEIQGSDCYISNAPINYSDMGSHAISGSIELNMGTLYPKKETPEMKTIQFKLGGDYTDYWTSPEHVDDGHTKNYTKIMSYPVSSTFLLPEYYPWHTGFTTGDYRYYISGWKIDDTSGKIYNPKSFLKVSDVKSEVNHVATAYAITRRRPVSEENYIYYDGSSYSPTSEMPEQSFVVEMEAGQPSMSVDIVIVGGGGGGASAYKVARKYRSASKSDTGMTIRKYYYRAILLAGGGGGGAGARVHTNPTYSTEFPITFTFKLGKAGQGGAGSEYDNIQSEDTDKNISYGNHGTDGGDSWVDQQIGSGARTRLITASGGLGGGTPSWVDTPDTSDGDIQQCQSLGGTGGSDSGNGGNGGYIKDDYHGIDFTNPGNDYFIVTKEYNGYDGGGVCAPGSGDEGSTGHAHDSGTVWLETWQANFSIMASGAGGGGALPVDDGVGSYGGDAGESWSDMSHASEIPGMSGRLGGGGGGGGAACKGTHNEEGHYTASGGDGSRGYLIVNVTGGVIVNTSW